MRRNGLSAAIAAALLACCTAVPKPQAPFDVAWRLAARTDIDCDGSRDHIFVAGDEAHYYIAAVVDSKTTYVQVGLEALCGTPRLEEEDLDFDIVEALGDEPEGWRRSRTCKGLRLGSGDCDAVHLYWNEVRQQLDWWRL